MGSEAVSPSPLSSRPGTCHDFEPPCASLLRRTTSRRGSRSGTSSAARPRRRLRTAPSLSAPADTSTGASSPPARRPQAERLAARDAGVRRDAEAARERDGRAGRDRREALGAVERRRARAARQRDRPGRRRCRPVVREREADGPRRAGRDAVDRDRDDAEEGRRALDRVVDDERVVLVDGRRVAGHAVARHRRRAHADAERAAAGREQAAPPSTLLRGSRAPPGVERSPSKWLPR